jgi:hypothetical protein
MGRAEAGERSSPAVTPTTPNRTRPVGRVRDAVVILLPAALVSLMLHLWAVMSPAARVNSDEALTGLQAYNVLQGRFAPMVEGNDYGGALESYLTAPLLLVSAQRDHIVPRLAARALFDVVASGKVKIEVKQRFPLEDAAGAHRALEARKTSGSTVLTI